MHVNKNKIGIVVGGFVGFMHLVWILLLATGFAQPYMDFIFRIHHINPLFEVAPFNFGTAILLLIITSIIGYVIGFIIGIIWNKVHALS